MKKEKNYIRSFGILLFAYSPCSSSVRNIKDGGYRGLGAVIGGTNANKQLSPNQNTPAMHVTVSFVLLTSVTGF